MACTLAEVNSVKCVLLSLNWLLMRTESALDLKKKINWTDQIFIWLCSLFKSVYLLPHCSPDSFCPLYVSPSSPETRVVCTGWISLMNCKHFPFFIFDGVITKGYLKNLGHVVLKNGVPVFLFVFLSVQIRH